MDDRHLDRLTVEELVAMLPRLRGLLGWNQTDLAQRVGVHQTTVSEWDAGNLPSRHNERILRSVLAEAFAGSARSTPRRQVAA